MWLEIHGKKEIRSFEYKRTKAVLDLQMMHFLIRAVVHLCNTEPSCEAGANFNLAEQWPVR